jgi:hypothetical protein
MPASCRGGAVDESLAGCLRSGLRPRGRRPAGCPLGERTSFQALLREGANGVGFGQEEGSDGLPVVVGFSTSPAAVRWQRPLGPGDGRTALHLDSYAKPEIAGGRAAAIYRDTAQEDRLVVLDALGGRTLWETKVDDPARKKTGIGRLLSAAITRTRVYIMRRPRLEVRDAATGRVLGVVGPPED